MDSIRLPPILANAMCAVLFYVIPWGMIMVSMLHGLGYGLAYLGAWIFAIATQLSWKDHCEFYWGFQKTKGYVGNPSEKVQSYADWLKQKEIEKVDRERLKWKRM